MPANRATIDRETKRRELIQIATVLFREHGYEATSIARLANEAGVAKNTVYWYFEDKDALLLAVVDALFSATLARPGTEAEAEAHPRRLDDLLVAITTFFQRNEPLTAALHARVRHSPALAAWHEGFHTRADRHLAAALGRHRADAGLPALPAADVAAAVDVVTFAIEGLVLHGASEARARDTFGWLVGSLSAPAA